MTAFSTLAFRTVAACCLIAQFASSELVYAANSMKTIGVLQFGDARQPQVDGFIAGLAELGYKEGKHVKFDQFNAKNDRKKLAGAVAQFLQNKVDIIVAAGGLEADAARKAAAASGVPVVVLYVNAILERKLVESRREAGWAVTGVDNLNSEISGKRLELLHSLVPSIKRVLVLYYPGIAPSRIGVEHAQAAAEKLGISLDARPVSSPDEVKAIMDALQPGEVDAMLTVPTAPIDGVLKKLILPKVNALELPLMTHSKRLAMLGALASYGAHLQGMGEQAARLADKVMKGIDVKRIPFEIPKRFVYSVNRTIMENLNIAPSQLAESQINEYVSAK